MKLRAVWLVGAIAWALASDAAAQRRPEAEARAHFRRGLERADVGDYNAAMAEFSRAWEITRNPSLLFNIATTLEALQRNADALDAMERYAREAPAAVVTSRRAEVDAALARLRTRVGTLTVNAPAGELTVRVDGLEVPASAARAGLRVNAGRRRVGVASPGFQPVEREVDVTGGESVVVEGPARRVESSLAIECEVPGASVRVDGSVVATTPVESPLVVAEGSHTVQVVRAGYTPFSTLVEARGLGARVRAELAWSPDPGVSGARLILDASEPGAIASLDGHRIPTDGSAALPPGPHRLVVAREGFLPTERALDLPAGSTARERVVLVPTPAFRAAYMASARSSRRTAWTLLGAGIGVAVAGGVGFGVSYARFASADDLWLQVSDSNRGVSCDPRAFVPDTQASGCAGLASDLDAERSDWQVAAILSGSFSVLGLASAAVGAVMLSRAPTLERFLSARWRPTGGAGQVGVVVDF